MQKLIAALVVAASTLVAQKAQLPRGYWAHATSNAIIETTQTIRLEPELQGLTAGEQAAVKELLQVGEIMQRLYEDSRHPDAIVAHRELVALDRRLGSPAATRDLLTLYRLFQGPIASTLDNRREAFLPVRPQTPARNVYPPEITRADVDAFLSAHPAKRDAILGERTVYAAPRRRTSIATCGRCKAAGSGRSTPRCEPNCSNSPPGPMRNCFTRCPTPSRTRTTSPAPSII